MVEEKRKSQALYYNNVYFIVFIAILISLFVSIVFFLENKFCSDRQQIKYIEFSPYHLPVLPSYIELGITSILCFVLDCLKN